MQSLRKSIAEFVLARGWSTNFTALLQMFTNMEPQVFNKISIIGLHEVLSVKKGFCDESTRDPTSLFRLLRNYLELKEFKYRQHSGNNKIM